MRRAIVTLLISVFALAPWASAQTAGPTVAPFPAKAGGGAPSAVRASQVAKKPVARRVARKKPAAVKKKAPAPRAPAKKPAATVKPLV